MKPTLTVMQSGGRLNADLDSSRTRILRGGSWKKQRIIIIIPAGENIPAQVALSHWSLIFPPNNNVCRILAQGMEVGEAYSNAIDSVLKDPELKTWEYILTIEHDNTPPQDGVLKLLERMEEHPEFDCIGGLYWTKGEGGVPQIWGDPKDQPLNFRPQPPDANGGLVECCGTGMGFNLWRTSMFKDQNLRKPWFKTEKGVGGISTQDLWFWQDARKHGHRCAVDCNVRVGHMDETGFIW
jgi:hypothetical protein